MTKKDQQRAPSCKVSQFRSYRVRLPLTAIFLVAGLALTLASYPRVPMDSALYVVAVLIGYFIILTGILVRLYAITSISGHKTTTLITTGPYAYCRNPLYAGTFIIVIGFVFLIHSLTFAISTLPVIGLYLFGVVPAEEQVMRLHHGEAFDAYCQNVPRWIPKVRFAWLGDLFQASGFRREFETSVWWIATAVAVQTICAYRGQFLWSAPLNLP